MKKAETEIDDELRPEYDLASLQVKRLCPGRKSFGGSLVRLEPDVAEVFPDADSVNEALRFLIRIQRKTSRLSMQPEAMHDRLGQSLTNALRRI
jgi:hypothetical protein